MPFFQKRHFLLTDIIGERERANLVVQLARFTGAAIPNKRNVHVILQS